MPNAEQIGRAFERISLAIGQYGDGFVPQDVAEVLRSKLNEIIVLRLNQFALRDVPHEELYAFIATDILVAIGDTYRGSTLDFDVMYTPKTVLWVDENRKGQPVKLFRNAATPKPGKYQIMTEKPASEIVNAAGEPWTKTSYELVPRRDLAWSYQTTPGSTFEEVVRAVVAFVPLAVAGVLAELR